MNKSGIKKLLDNKSNVNGSYQEFSHLSVKKFRFVWDARRDGSVFAKSKLKLNFDGVQVSVTFASDLFLKFETRNTEDLTIVTITDIFKQDEIEKLKISETKGNKKSLSILIKDETGISSLVKTDIKLEFVHKKMFWWYVVFSKTIPAEALEIMNDSIKINIGQLGISSKHTKRGKRVRYTLWITRTFGDKSTTAKLHQKSTKLR
jgi:hypothetical protein